MTLNQVGMMYCALSLMRAMNWFSLGLSSLSRNSDFKLFMFARMYPARVSRHDVTICNKKNEQFKTQKPHFNAADASLRRMTLLEHFTDYLGLRASKVVELRVDTFCLCEMSVYMIV